MPVQRVVQDGALGLAHHALGFGADDGDGEDAVALGYVVGSHFSSLSAPMGHSSSLDNTIISNLYRLSSTFSKKDTSNLQQLAARSCHTRVAWEAGIPIRLTVRRRTSNFALSKSGNSDLSELFEKFKQFRKFEKLDVSELFEKFTQFYTI